MVLCYICKELLPAESFYKSKGGRNGLASRCKNCSKKYLRIWRGKNKEKWHKIQMRCYWKKTGKFQKEKREKRLRYFKKRSDEIYYSGMRSLVYRKFSNKCFTCGVRSKEGGRDHAVHHVDGTGVIGKINGIGFRTTPEGIKIRKLINNSLKNLVLLCASCHGKVHRGSLKLPLHAPC